MAVNHLAIIPNLYSFSVYVPQQVVYYAKRGVRFECTKIQAL